MALPALTIYSGPTGQSIHGGRWPGGWLVGNVGLDSVMGAGAMAIAASDLNGNVTLDSVTLGGTLFVAPPPTVALVGDSLTALSYGPLHPYCWTIGLAGGVLKTVANCGVAADTIQNVIDRIDNDYTDAAPGLAGLTSLGWAFLRIGTNNFRGGQSINTTTQGQYQTLITKMLTYAQRVVVFAVPPVNAIGDAAGAGIPGVNAWLASYCAGDSRLAFIDDTVNVRSGGNWAAAYLPGDGIHFSNAGSYRMGQDGGAALTTLLSGYGYSSPVSSNAADVYPAQPQWALNPSMAGSGGTNAIGTGQVPNSWTVGAFGSGFAAASAIVAADGGDPNSAPWVRVTPSAIGAANAWFGANPALSASATAAISSSVPDTLEFVVEVRFNAFDVSKFKYMRAYVYGNSNENLTPAAFLRMGDSETISQTVVFRQAVRRSATRVAHASAVVNLHLEPIASYTGSIGSFDVRCLTVRVVA